MNTILALLTCFTFGLLQLSEVTEANKKGKGTGCTGPDDFICSNGQCIEKGKKCDGIIDCDDQTDEIFCDITYSASQLERSHDTGPKSIVPRNVLDLSIGILENVRQSLNQGVQTVQSYVPHVPHINHDSLHNKQSTSKTQTIGKNGPGQSNPSCIPEKNYYECLDGNCIHQQQVCDGVPDCKNGSDEESCVVYNTSPHAPMAASKGYVHTTKEVNHQPHSSVGTSAISPKSSTYPPVETSAPPPKSHTCPSVVSSAPPPKPHTYPPVVSSAQPSKHHTHPPTAATAKPKKHHADSHQITTHATPPSTHSTTTAKKPPIKVIKQCLGNDFPCHNGYTCVDPSMVCNGVNNCGDNSDEFVCPSYGNISPTINKTTRANPETSKCIETAQNHLAHACSIASRKHEFIYVRFCPDGEAESDYLYQGKNSLKERTVITSECIPGFTREHGGPVDLTCEKGNWSPVISECKRICEKFYTQNLINVKCYYHSKPVDCENPFFAGTKITYSCRPPTHSDPNAQPKVQELICLTYGKWNRGHTNCENTLTNSATTPFTPPKDASVVVQEKCQAYNAAAFEQKPINLSSARCSQNDEVYKETRQSILVDFPHTALIGYFDGDGTFKWFCDGSLISDRFVLSSATCGKTDYGGADWIVFGDPYQQKDVSKILNRYPHPDYKSSEFDNDIALYELKYAVKLSSTLRPICLSTTDMVDRSDVVIATSWYNLDEQNKYLIQQSMYLEEAECKKQYHYLKGHGRGFDAVKSLCGRPYKYMNNTHRGGPLQIALKRSPCLWSQIGITSTVSTDYDQNHYTFYVKVAPYIDWIQKIVWPNT